MKTLSAAASLLLVIDVQQRLMPAIAGADRVVGNARRLLEAATLLDVPTLLTEQNPAGLGATVEALRIGRNDPVVAKMSFDACREETVVERLPARPHVVVAGCEAHVCVLQTALGLLDMGRHVSLVRDALGARREQSLEAALQRAAGHGAEVVTTEMVVFEWLGGATHPRFRDVIALVK